MTDYDLAVARGAALMEAYINLTGQPAPSVEELLVDLVAYRAAGGGECRDFPMPMPLPRRRANAEREL